MVIPGMEVAWFEFVPGSVSSTIFTYGTGITRPFTVKSSIFRRQRLFPPTAAHLPVAVSVPPKACGAADAELLGRFADAQHFKASFSFRGGVCTSGGTRLGLAVNNSRSGREYQQRNRRKTGWGCRIHDSDR